MHHSRAIAADILAEKEDAIGFVEIVKADGSDRDADTFGSATDVLS